MAKVSDKLLKFFVWLKILLIVVLLLYTLLFVLMNQRDVELWYSPFADRVTTPVLVALIVAFILGCLLTLLVRMVVRTWSQYRAARDRERTERLEREIVDMRTKANRLQARE